MKRLRSLALFSLLICQQVSSFVLEEEIVEDGNGHVISKRIRRQLTQHEQELANTARTQIAKAIENNLIRIFAIATAQHEHPYPRQDGDEDVDIDIVTPNPNVLPQVAQILGAVFSGSLNITRIVDGTVGLVPNIVRNQLQGLVKLLTGENVNLSTALGGTTTLAPTKTASEIDSIFEEEPSTVVPLASEPKLTSPVPETTIPTTTVKNARYRLRNKTRRSTTTPSTVPQVIVDDEIERIERDLRAAARILEPYEHKEPRFYAGMFTNILQNVNMTEITKAVPSIFKGATQAVVMLEDLGVLDALPGSETLVQDLDEVENEEEE